MRIDRMSSLQAQLQQHPLKIVENELIPFRCYLIGEQHQSCQLMILIECRTRDQEERRSCPSAQCLCTDSTKRNAPTLLNSVDLATQTCQVKASLVFCKSMFAHNIIMLNIIVSSRASWSFGISNKPNYLKSLFK